MDHFLDLLDLLLGQGAGGAVVFEKGAGLFKGGRVRRGFDTVRDFFEQAFAHGVLLFDFLGHQAQIGTAGADGYASHGVQPRRR